MKKKIFTIIIVLLICNQNFAQSKNQLGFVFGPNHFSLRESDDAESGFGFSLGFSFERKINNNLSFLTGITLVERNLKYSSEFTFEGYDQFDNYFIHDYKVKTKNKYQHFTIPFLLKYGVGKNNSIFISGGGYISTKGKNKKTTRLFNETLDYSYNVPTTDQYNFKNNYDVIAFDYGVSLGVGKSFKIKNKTELSVELRENFGLTPGDNSSNKTNTVNLIGQLSFDL